MKARCLVVFPPLLVFRSPHSCFPFPPSLCTALPYPPSPCIPHILPKPLYTSPSLSVPLFYLSSSAPLPFPLSILFPPKSSGSLVPCSCLTNVSARVAMSNGSSDVVQCYVVVSNTLYIVHRFVTHTLFLSTVVRGYILGWVNGACIRLVTLRKQK